MRIARLLYLARVIVACFLYFEMGAFNASAQSLYAMDQVNKTLWGMNLDGSARSAVLTFASTPWDVKLDAAAGKLYWTESDKVVSANLDGSNQQILWQPGPSGLKGIAEDTSAGKLYVMDQLNLTLWVMNLDGSARSAVLTFASNPWDITLDEAAHKLYWTESDKVVSANPDGSNQQTLWQPGPSGLKGIAEDTTNGKLYVMDQVNKILWGMNLDGSARSAVLTFAVNPWDIALNGAAGKLYWTESDKVVSANLDGSSQQFLWQPGPSGLKGIAIIPEPTTWALTAFGMVALGFKLRRPRHRPHDR